MRNPSHATSPIMRRTLINPSRNNSVAPETSKRMSRTAQRDNPRERCLRSELHRRGLRFRLHRKLIEGSRRTVDIAFPTQRVAIFLYGCFWHGCPMHGTWPKTNADWWREKIETNVRRDRDTNLRLKRAGWKVIRVWEHEDIHAAANRIERSLRLKFQSGKIRP
jgi:DNA mismatch endonuclease (patch repair protein)